MVQAAAAVLFGVCLAVLVGFDDAGSAEVTAAIKSEVDEKKAVHPELIFPIPYDATVTMGAGRTRFYVRGEK